ncbi:MAG: cyclic nucleotide-binding domain-containing protein [Bryobacteraceae bacterium]|jgi:CRP-like cAMP-binding protein
MECSSLFEGAREQPFLKGLSAEHIEKMMAMASEVRFAADDIIFREGEKSDFFYLLLSAKVAPEVCTSGHILRVQTLGEGDELGWSSYLEEETRRFQARALVRVQALRFEGARLRKACTEDRDLGCALEHRLLQVVSGRLQATLFQLLDMYGPPKSGQKAAHAAGITR